MCGALAAWGAIGAGAWFVVKFRGPGETLPTLDTALQALDAGRHTEARRVALQLLDNDKLRSEERGGPLFVLGVVTAQEADKAHFSDEQRQLYLAGARYLADARDEGFPPGREPEGLYLLANSEFRAGRYKPSIELLVDALEANPSRQTELSGLLAQACLNVVPPRLAEALKYNQQYLADDNLSSVQRHAAWLERSRIELLLGDIEASTKTLDAIPASSGVDPAVLVMRSRLIMHGADQVRAGQPAEAGVAAAQSQYQEAAKLLRQVTGHSGFAEPSVREAQYLLGLCLARSGELREAEKQFARVRRIYRGTYESLPAALEEAELLRSAGRSRESLAGYTQALEEAGDPQTYHNPWLPLDQLKARVEAAVENLREREELEAAASLVELLSGILSPQRSTELKGEVEQAWGKSLLAQADVASPANRIRLAAEGRLKFREAGGTFAQLAELRKAEREFPDDLWRSAQNYSAGQDYRRALVALKQYVIHESRRRRSEALIAIGQCYLALNKLDQALPPLLECIESFRKSPESYRARLIASQAYLERNELEEAKTLLIDNLENESLTPSSLEWRDSLFALGKLLHRQATDMEALSLKRGVDSPYPEEVKIGLVDLEKSFQAHQEAASRLSEAVERYPDAPQVIEARYLIAESHRQSAKWPRKLRGTIAIETVRATLARQVKEELTAAHAEYEPLLALLNERQERESLSPLEAVVMRNCYFARADVLFDLERFDDAIAAYSSATNRYHDRPEALEAFVQIASCYRRMNRPAEARGTLEQAKVVLRRLPADAVFTQTTRYDRGEWTQLLSWLSSL